MYATAGGGGGGGLANSKAGMTTTGPLEVLIKAKWYRATASVVDAHFGIALDDQQDEGPLSVALMASSPSDNASQVS